MVVDERSRHALYRRLEEVLGPEAAMTLIEHLPPVGWADVATKSDLAALEDRLELRFARADDKFERLIERVDSRFAQVDDQFERLIAQVDGRFAQTDDQFERLIERFDGRFAQVDGQFERLIERFDSRFAQVDGQFERLIERFDSRFAQVDGRFAQVDSGFTRIDERSATSEENLTYRFEALESKIRASFEHELRGQAITLFFAQVTVVLTLAALAFALVRFT